jgi:hypothetical protein
MIQRFLPYGRGSGRGTQRQNITENAEIAESDVDNLYSVRFASFVVKEA